MATTKKGTMSDSHSIEFMLDGQVVSATEGETVLSVAKRYGVDIPSLCHHEALVPSGACRLCIVEISRVGGSERERDIAASCQYPVSQGLIVKTRSDRVLRHRRIVASLLFSLAPDCDILEKLTRSLGGAVPYPPPERMDNCILCTLCTRTCAALGAEAIHTSGRGSDKQIAPPLSFGDGGCVGCGACHRACPTGCIEMTDTAESRTIWDHTFEFVKCSVCGAPTVTRDHMALAMKRSGLNERYFTLCAACKQKETAETFAELSLPLGTGE
jgi:bidirectional [NiFe] hydrogenase diaphorase subunit